MSDLQGALINALERIESLENYRDELEQLLQAFNEQMKAAKLHGAGCWPSNSYPAFARALAAQLFPRPTRDVTFPDTTLVSSK